MELLSSTSGAAVRRVVIADDHAIRVNGLSADEVRRVANQYRSIVAATGEVMHIENLEVSLASELHASVQYRQILDELCARTGLDPCGYFTMEAADIEYMRRNFPGGVLKLGWSIGSPPHAATGKRDEEAFDSFYRDKFSPAGGVGFAYVGAQRTLSKRHPRLPPYLLLVPEAQIAINAAERVHEKLAEASRDVPDLARAFLNQLRATIRSIARHLPSLTGSVEDRLSQTIQLVLGRAAGAQGVA
jgi:hypothetical protein